MKTINDIRTTTTISKVSTPNGNILMENNSSMILKGILAVPSTSRAVSPENSSPNTSRVPSPNGLQSAKKISSSASKERTPKKNSKKNRSPQTTPEVASTSYFASSAFMNSPDPLTIPLPNFDDDEDEIFQPHHDQNKTNALWQLLQVK